MGADDLEDATGTLRVGLDDDSGPWQQHKDKNSAL